MLRKLGIVPLTVATLTMSVQCAPAQDPLGGALLGGAADAIIGGTVGGNYGFDAGEKEYVDLIEAGIIDPTKVVRVALQNAVSVASVLLLTEATMTEVSDDKNEPLEPELAA